MLSKILDVAAVTDVKATTAVRSWEGLMTTARKGGQERKIEIETERAARWEVDAESGRGTTTRVCGAKRRRVLEDTSSGGGVNKVAVIGDKKGYTPRPQKRATGKGATKG